MAYLLFVDESGQDRRESPYEVLAGVAVRDSELWPLIGQVGELEHFGRRYSDGRSELKAKKICELGMSEMAKTRKGNAGRASKASAKHSTRFAAT